jgi:general secretion pathway protein N
MPGRAFMLGFAVLLAWDASTARAELAIAPATLDPFDVRKGSEMGDVAPQPPQSARRETPGPAIGSPLWAIPLTSLSATRDRPIFSPSRRPPPAVVAGPRIEPKPAPRPPAPPEEPRLRLLGTVVGGSQPIGVFLDDTTKDVVRLRMGEAHRGWDLRSVQGREVTLEKNRRAVIVAFPPPDAAAPQPLAGLPAANLPRGRASSQSADPPLLVPAAVRPLNAQNPVDAEPK